MKIKGKYIKRGTIITVVSIIVLTLATMNVSYSSFFSVQTQEHIPVITAGNLNVTASISKEENKELMPAGDYKNITDTGSSSIGDAFTKSTLTIDNKSNINIKVGVSLQDSVIENINNASPESVVIAIQKDNKWITFGTSNLYYVTLAQLVQSGNTYPIISDSISNGVTKVSYDIYMWLSETAAEEDAEKTLDYSVSVKAVPAEGQNADNQVTNVTTKG